MKKLWIGILLACCWQAIPLTGQNLFDSPELLLDVSQDIGYPRGLKAADLDADGDLDLFGSPLENDDVFVSENQGGTLTKPFGLSVGYGTTWDITMADLDGDSLPELLYVSATDGFYFRSNLGALAFGPAQHVPLPAITYRRLVAGDLDADGDADIIVGGTTGSYPDYQDQLYVVPNLGAGVLGTPFILDSLASGLSGFLLHDVNADSLPELFLFDRASDLIWWYPNSGGSLQAAATLIDTVDGPSQIYFADLDGNGVEDLIASSHYGRRIMRVAFAGGGTFGPAEMLNLPKMGSNTMIPSDLDADGDIDLIAHTDGTVAAWYNQGSLSFHADTLWEDDRYARRMVFADFNGNGMPDWAEATNALLAWRPNTGFEFGAWQALSRPAPANLAFGDMDGDGQLDLVNGDDVLVWQRMEPAGDPPTALINMNASGKPVVLDADGDGDNDVVTFEDLVLLHENLGTSWAEPKFIYDVWASEEYLIDGTPVPEEEYAYSDQPYTEDLDGDGDMDLIFLLGEYDTISLPSPTGLYERVVAFYNDGAGNFGNKRIIVDTLSISIKLLTGDLNGDDRADILVSDEDGLFTVLNDGSGAFSIPYRIAPSLAYDIDKIAIQDMDGDGLPDIIRSNSQWGVAWLRNRGGGLFGPDHILPEPCYYDCGIWPEDWDNDGDADLLLMHENRLSWYANQGGATAPSARQFLFYPDYEVHEAYRMDIDGDGLEDLVSKEGDYHDDKVFWRKNLRSGCTSPSNLQDSLLNDSTVILSWNPVPAAQGYRIRIGRVGASWQKRLAAVDHRLQVSGLPTGQSLAWSVRAACDDAKSGFPPKAYFNTPGMRLSQATSEQPWPNPSTGWLMVSGEGPASLWDPMGRVRWSGMLHGSTRIDLSQLPAGTYWLDWTEGGMSQRKAILLR